MKIYIKGSDDFYLFIKNLCETHNVSTNIIGKDNKMYYNLDPIQKGV
jgi:hypothetical protein